MSETYHVTKKECPKHNFDKLWFVPKSEFTPNGKIQELIDKYEKRSNDSHRPPFEQEAYSLVAYDLRQLIGDSDEDNDLSKLIESLKAR